MQAEEAFGQVLRTLRLERGLSQEKLAFAAGIERNYVSLLERGQNAASIKILFKIAPVFGISVAALMDRVERVMGDDSQPPTE